jgi:hypothetical protein
MNISVHIERLVLDGVAVAPGQQPRLQAALQAELSRLLAEGGLSPGLLAGGAVPAVSGESLQLTGGGDPEALGRQIARALHGGLKR